MNLRRLRYFVAVAEEENVHRASERLHIAQPALSRQIRLLEEELGTTLFVRLPRGIALSPAGASYLEDARQILRLSDQARSRAIAVESGQMGTLRVGFHDAAHHYPVIKSAFKSFRAEFPNVHFRFVSSSSQNQFEALTTNNLDLGFAYGWEQPMAGLQHLSVANDDLGLALSTDHPLANKPKIYVDDIRNEQFLWADTVSFRSHSDAIMRACAAIGFIPNVWHQGLTSLEAMISLVAAGMGLAIIPKAASSESVIVRTIEGLSHPVELMLVWQGEGSSAVASNFISHTRQVLEARPN
ncbi:MAG: LysR family regulatory protein CidR [Sphingomonadales bacterium]|jgi:DNA-binding transcriptional LysR family regulator|nr:LysR family regulatory protein CidR [Sphingomonadales bacterium]